MLFYRARLEGTIAAVVSLKTGPVRRRPGLGGGEGLVRVMLRYALAPTGEVRVHRGWLHTHLPGGTRLQLSGYQVDGTELVLSLRPRRPAAGGPERLEDRFRLPFRLHAWGIRAIRALSARLRLMCSAESDAMLLHGWLRLIFETPAGRLRLAVPFCRLVAGAAGEGLDWRAYGGVVGLSCRVELSGDVVGEAVLAVSCLGSPPAQPEPIAPPAMAAVRELTGRLGALTAEYAGEGRALVRGTVELELAWADGSGQSRWTGREAPFATLMQIPGLSETDRLAPVAQIDQVSRVGTGPESRAAILVAVGVTALRTVHLPLDGQWYRLEQVMGQATASLTALQPLFDRPSSPPERLGPSGAEAVLPAGSGDGWQQLRLELKQPVVEGGAWRSALSLAVWPGEAGERVLVGRLPDGAVAAVVGLEAVGPGGVRVRAQGSRIPRGAHLAPPRRSLAGEADRSLTTLALPGPVRALPGLTLSGGASWEARLLVRLQDGLRLLATDLETPSGPPGGAWQPLAVTAYPLSQTDGRKGRLRLEVHWQRPDP